MQILLDSGDEEGAARVARAATGRYSQSVAAWSLCLQTLVQLESVDMSQLFQEALSHVHPKVLTATRYKRFHSRLMVLPACFYCGSASIIGVACVETHTHSSS